MAKRIITISRQFGSGGRTIGQEVAKELGIPCYDKELIEKIKSKGVDPCGENGEYHTFVVDGPIFDYKIDIKYDKSKIEENYALSIM